MTRSVVGRKELCAEGISTSSRGNIDGFIVAAATRAESVLVLEFYMGSAPCDSLTASRAGDLSAAEAVPAHWSTAMATTLLAARSALVLATAGRSSEKMLLTVF